MSERDRHELYRRLEGVIGKEPADTMMALLPPVGWADVATKDDLRNLEERLSSRMDSMESRINERIVRTVVTVNIPTLFAAFALAFAAVRFG